MKNKILLFFVFHKSFIYFYQHRLSIHVSKLYFYFNMSVYLLLPGNSTIANHIHQIYFEKKWYYLITGQTFVQAFSALLRILHSGIFFTKKSISAEADIIWFVPVSLNSPVKSILKQFRPIFEFWSWWNFTSESRKFRRFHAIECRLSDQSQDCVGASAPAPPTPCSPCSGCTSRNPQVRHTWCKTWSLLMPSFGRRERI